MGGFHRIDGPGDRPTVRACDTTRADWLTPHPRRLSPTHPHFAAVALRHGEAVAAGRPTYRDPASGLSVFTAAFLRDRGYCCDSGCRHCPYLGA